MGKINRLKNEYLLQGYDLDSEQIIDDTYILYNLTYFTIKDFSKFDFSKFYPIEKFLTFDTYRVSIEGLCVTNIDWISKLQSPDFTHINVSCNLIRDISALSDLKYITHIDMSSNYVTDISPLYKIESLEWVDISANEIPQESVEHFSSKCPRCYVKGGGCNGLF